MMSDPVRLEIYKHLFSSIAEEMGVVLRRTGFSPNIKERRDFSCALFDSEADMIAQAAHIPVHLGAMPASVQSAVQELDFAPGDVVILNDPYKGGTHLPDITLISPIFIEDGGREVLFGFAANRAHHSDVGGMSPGSMPLSNELYQEGVIIPPLKLVERGMLKQELFDFILANVRTPQERAGDLRAQMAANHVGVERMKELVSKYGMQEVQQYMGALLSYSERLTRQLLGDLPSGTYAFSDRMDDDGVTSDPAIIAVKIHIAGEEATVDFSGTSPQRKGSINAVLAITMSATYYVFRSLIGLDVPSNSGCYKPIQVIAPRGTLVNARPHAAVAGGNVETSQRITDVLLGALAQACPDRVPAASQGSMNNVTVGGWDPERGQQYAYYETVAGGAGASQGRDGVSGVHSHMTNTMNTPIEAIEFAYPMRIQRYEIRAGSGGAGLWKGGDGIRRDLELLSDAQVTILSERRRYAPYGLRGGEPGLKGRNVLLREGGEEELPGKFSMALRAGDVVSIRTPGGGGYGTEETERSK